MIKLLSGFIFISFLLLASCSFTSESGSNKSHNTAVSGASSTVAATVAAAAADKDTDSVFQLDSEVINGIMFRDVTAEQSRVYTITNLIAEFRSLLVNQSYLLSETKWDVCYKTELLDENNDTLLEISFGAGGVIFGRDVRIGGSLLKKGVAYDTEQWIYDYMREFFEGQVLNPVHIGYPARLEIPTDIYTVEMLDSGSSKINQYDTFSRLNAFTGKYISGKEFEIVGSERLFNNKSIQDEASKANGNQCLVITYNTSENYMDIHSANEYNELAKAYTLTFYKHPEIPDAYELVADTMVFYIRVGKDFDTAFRELFAQDRKTDIKLTPSDITTLFREKKPNYMEYICKNLGMTGWDDREDNKLDVKSMKLDSSSPYKVLCFSNPYDLRLLIFKYDNKTWNFTGYIDFGGRQAGTDYSTEKAGGRIWIVGNRCRGYGTGESINNREWYIITDKGVSLALSIPFDSYEVGPYGGYIYKAEDIKLKTGKNVSISADYNITRVYMLDIDSADEYRQVNMTGKKNMVFTWDDKEYRFVSACETDSRGLTVIPPEYSGLSENCGKLLDKNYDRLTANIKNLSEQNVEEMKRYKAQGIKEFLNDCPDSDKKAALCRLLNETYSGFIH